MASQLPSQPHPAASSQAGLAALRAHATVAPSPQSLFALIDAYAQAAAERERMRDAAAWALVDAHRAMLTAREAVAAALGIAIAALPHLTDEATAIAEHAEGVAR